MKNKLTHFILSLIYIISSLIGMILLPFFMNQPWVGTYVICLLGYLALGFLLLILFHSLITKYECSHCHHQFKINFFKDLFTIGSNQGKKITCPNCKKTDYVQKISE
jgi:DNA-directed RNA polymerase subunit RPC12/RpoP